MENKVMIRIGSHFVTMLFVLLISMFAENCSNADDDDENILRARFKPTGIFEVDYESPCNVEFEEETKDIMDTLIRHGYSTYQHLKSGELTFSKR